MIHMVNYSMKTKYEQLQDDKKTFQSMMPLLAKLDAREQKSLIHMLYAESEASQFLNVQCSSKVEEDLAKLSEQENYAVKNRYRHQNKTMNFAEAKKMPIDEKKVKDLLRHQHIFRDRMNKEIGTYQAMQDNPQMQNGILTYLNEAAAGEMKDLINDVGINKDAIPFYNLARMNKVNDNQSHTSDKNFHYLVNAMFTPLDMTDHEDSFVGWHEIGGDLPINRQSWLAPLQEEAHP